MEQVKGLMSVVLKLLFFVLIVSSFVSCATYQLKPDENITEQWVDKSKNNTENVSTEEAGSFVSHFFKILDQAIFDPEVRIKELKLAKKNTFEELKRSSSHSRKEVLSLLNQSLKKVDLSHLVYWVPSILK